MKDSSFIEVQQEFCLEKQYECAATLEDEIVGFATSTQGEVPVNGLRHHRDGNTSGWYIWYGEELSTSADFFSSLHAHHLNERCPEIVKLLGLPPGYRFLAAGDYLDIWFDESLLADEEEC